MKNKSENGMITLEACVSVMIFMTLMLIVLGLFQMFMAQNATSHCLVETSESLSLDSFATSKLKSSDITDGLDTYISDIVTSLFGSAEKSPSFVNDTAWYSGGSVSLGSIIKTRFVGYLSGGDEEAANNFLKAVNVVNGLDGLDFSQSKIVNGDLRIVLHYDLEYSFRIWGLGTVPVTQKAVSRMWAEDANTINQE